MEKICGIYKITSPSGRIYIGESVNINKRKRDYSSLNCKIQPKLYNSLRKYGWESHNFEVIEVCKFDELLCRERYWQDFYDVLNGGLNCELTNCGDKKRVLSLESRNKISISKKGFNHPLFGKSLSINHKNKISKSMIGVGLGNKFSQEHKTNLSESHKGLYENDKHPRARLILCQNTGIFYYTLKDAAEAICMKSSTLCAMLKGQNKNKTSYIYC
jgi:group I intron endonuclease